MKEVVDARITTKDNKFDPFNDFDNWYAYDTAKGYDSCSILARIAKTSTDLSIEDYAKANEEAIDSIVSLGIIPNAVKVTRTIIVE